ncbi:phage tail protein [Lentzea sp. NPDC051208]|uniref:phage tail protein n=1 Tax=Lentzea sp. NPDC051208 TaxID=3154642 RepID=UPI0034155279
MLGGISNAGQMLGPNLVGALLDPADPPNGRTPVKLGLAMRFVVVVDDISLGHWSSCSGLKVEFKTAKVNEGGEYRKSTVLPDRIEYGQLTLKRAVHRNGSDEVQRWLQRAMNDWMNSADGSLPVSQTATITVMDANNDPVYAWTLTGVQPMSWTGPELDASTSRVAVETLTCVYDGIAGASSHKTSTGRGYTGPGSRLI